MLPIAVLFILLATFNHAIGQDGKDGGFDQLAFADAYNHKDAAAMANFFSKQAIRVTPSGIFRGRDEIRQNFQAALDMGIHDYTVKRVHSQIYGDLTFNIGEWNATVGSDLFRGYYTAILGREEDQIKILEETVTIAAPSK